ncbi:hypothetical protein RRG08_026739 [Elysia crispata]|uniref:Integrase catalytic domain-containing protein n=1 Tax=Elysia crispata TaxID=231223 RepID=A0AAE1E2G2_9GAST|nr:hypothetical protein RRG08_026739 [Elysia crispata]
MKEPFNKCPARVQRFLLRLEPYDLQVSYKKGKEQVLSDTLSRATEQNSSMKPEIPQQEIQIQAFVDCVVKTLHVTPQKITEIKHRQENDETLQKLRAQIKAWPQTIRQVPKEIQPYWTVREDITECDGILLKGDQVIIPEAMQHEMLQLIHQGHLGVELSQNRAKTAVFWPGMMRQIEKRVNSCHVCQRHRNAQHKEPLQPHDIPNETWIKLATDLFHFDGKDFLLVCDYFSKFFEVCKLDLTTSESGIKHLKNIFARHGTPISLVSGNGSQYASRTFQNFLKTWDIEHIRTSPAFSRSNGFIERNVQTIKKIVQES